MGDVINFAAILQARRVAAAVDAQQAAAAKRANDRRTELHDRAERAGAGLAGRIMAEAMANVADANEERERASRYMPAYCDPANESRGSKYEATRNLPLTEVAKRMRADIKAAQVAGTLAVGLKVSVRVAHHTAIDVRVTAAPNGFAFHNPAALHHEHETRNGPWSPFHRERYSPEWKAAKDALEAIHRSYNRDNSDSMTDYFDVRFYGDVGIWWELERPTRERELATALAATN
ncbi:MULTISPECIES: hypothetical protein [unclassified Sphingomonas]|uniref:hypothetical protein n=1 Tax=unclassified Sphingomonas TaxID=196159 RepID=UPI00226ACE9A|nr:MULTISPECIES: hypothetical protein [unclassified Sphingomonas]